ncbi:mycothiol system anti-sigma-R factor [Ktedonospora formicarum]|uniref:Putative zinc-finger domain-containing protein n=1 Tax=Ktedonospora formicarum TaxID=2778364 RepID=A0A8J3MXY5_9CHLR|nr:mycothiol system anti-sigma-R factor [Ktedonospora formicarum]GHO50203.1 hypothetical protein KSX_83660 [Ktedonospora formicarum]
MGENTDCLSCVEITARLHLYIDRELDSSEIEIVQQHLTTCPGCECRFYLDEKIKRLVHDCCVIERAPRHLREKIMRIAKGEQVEIDPELAMKIHADLEGC